MVQETFLDKIDQFSLNGQIIICVFYVMMTFGILIIFGIGEEDSTYSLYSGIVRIVISVMCLANLIRIMIKLDKGRLIME